MDDDDSGSHKGRFALLLALLALAWVYMVSDEERFDTLSKGADALLDRVLP